MVKKVRRFVIFVLFSFFYSLLSSSKAHADSTLFLVPTTGKVSDGQLPKLSYKGNPTNVEIDDSTIS